MRWLAVFWILAPAVWAGVDPRKSASDYPTSATCSAGSLGAEYVGRFVSMDGASHQTGDYVAVEIGFYPASPGAVTLRASDLLLRINGSKQLVYPQPAGLVAGSVRHPEWEHPRGLEAGAGMGGAGVVFGRPRRTSRFPGDPTSDVPARIPADPNRQGVSDPRDDPLEMAARAIAAQALDEGSHPGPRAGYIYFIFKKKLTALKKLELVWACGQQRRTLALK